MNLTRPSRSSGAGSRFAAQPANKARTLKGDERTRGPRGGRHQDTRGADVPHADANSAGPTPRPEPAAPPEARRTPRGRGDINERPKKKKAIVEDRSWEEPRR